MKGTPNKATAWVKLAASQFTDEALRVLASIMRDTKEDARARVSAAKELLDRAHGKPPQALIGDDGTPPIPVRIIHEFHPGPSPTGP